MRALAALLTLSFAFTTQTLASDQQPFLHLTPVSIETLSQIAKDDYARAHKEWDASTGVLCDAQHLQKNYTTAKQCLEDRRKSADYQSEKFSPFKTQDGTVFYFSRHHKVTLVTDKDLIWDEKTYLHGITDIAYPQVDNPDEYQSALNTAIINSADTKKIPSRKLDGMCELTYSYTPSMLGPTIASLHIEQGYYCPGAAHGDAYARTLNWLIPLKRELSSKDIFKFDDKHMQPLLTDLAVEDFQQQKKSIYNAVIERLSNKVTDTSIWQISPTDLTLHFGGIGAGVDGFYTATIPWQKLEPYLASNDIIKAIRTPAQP